MHERKWRAGRIECFFCQMQHDRAVFTDGVKHNRVFAHGRDFTHNVNRLGFKAVQMGQIARPDRSLNLQISQLSNSSGKGFQSCLPAFFNARQTFAVIEQFARNCRQALACLLRKRFCAFYQIVQL